MWRFSSLNVHLVLCENDMMICIIVYDVLLVFIRSASPTKLADSAAKSKPPLAWYKRA